MLPRENHLSLRCCRRLRLPGMASSVLIPRPIALHLRVLASVVPHLVRSCLPLVPRPVSLAPTSLAAGSGIAFSCPNLSVVVLKRTTLSLRFCRNPLPLPDPWHWLQSGPSRWQALVRPTIRASLVSSSLTRPTLVRVALSCVDIVANPSLSILQSCTLRLARKPTAPVVRPKPPSPV